ncbi:MAG: CinA family protein [Lautropia sp.]|nr:CinA family protein [Lautropia sp.]
MSRDESSLELQAGDDIQALSQLAEQLGGLIVRLGGGLISTAESCTGGLIATALTETPGSSGWFSRAYVTYANQAKVEMLGVSPGTLQTQGAVSEAVAREMALGAMGSDEVLLSMAVSGIAGPSGGLPDKPAGTVCFGWAMAWPKPSHSAPLVLTETRLFSGDRQAVRRQAAAHALARARVWLQSRLDDTPLVG